jgi:uncharacterized SAM-binding protein YcdF (DUF218 family)
MKDAGPRVALGLAIGGVAGFSARELNLQDLISFWHSTVLWVPLGAFLGALVSVTRARLLGLLAAAALFAGYLVVAYTPLTASLARGLPRRDPPDPLRPADAIFVLSSRVQADGEPTSVALARLVHALELVGEGRAPRLVVSEASPPEQSYERLARAMMTNLRLKGEVLSVGKVGNTHDEAVATAALFRELGLRRVVVVTSALHSRRAAGTFERAGLEVWSDPAPEVDFDLETLDWPDERLRAFGSMIHERVGSFVYRRRGWL